MTQSNENLSKSKTENELGEMSESRFHMWRAIFALAHADEMISLEERQFMEDVLRREPLSDAQKTILQGDIKSPQDIGKMFTKIKDQADRSAFFYFARLLCWCDGDFVQQEQKIILKLKETHLKELNFDQMLGDFSGDMELDDEERQALTDDAEAVKSKRGNIQSFMRAFFRRHKERKA